MRLEKSDREGSWRARFPRNDQYCCTYEPHLLLANLGNVDWRPCLNMWAVIEYVTKYATKAPKGSKRLGDVLKAAVDEVCKYGKEGAEVDLLRQSLQKVFARTLGDRDFTLFEAVHLGLGLPQVFELLPTVSLNTYGTKLLKPQHVVAAQGEDEPITYDSKVDKFNKRLAILRAQNRGVRNPGITEAEIRDVSLFEFYWKFYVHRNRIHRSLRPTALMVTPSISADCANATHARHEMYARTCVVAFWRMMATEARHCVFQEGVQSARQVSMDSRHLGGTLVKLPLLTVEGTFDVSRFLGVQDLVEAFEGKWGMALMEMLVDPVLSSWVPSWVVEQYERWNPFFRRCVDDAIRRGLPDDNERRARRRGDRCGSGWRQTRRCSKWRGERWRGCMRKQCSRLPAAGARAAMAVTRKAPRLPARSPTRILRLPPHAPVTRTMLWLVRCTMTRGRPLVVMMSAVMLAATSGATWVGLDR